MNSRSNLYGIMLTGSLIASVVVGSLGPLVVTVVLVFVLEFLVALESA